MTRMGGYLFACDVCGEVVGWTGTPILQRGRVFCAKHDPEGRGLIADFHVGLLTELLEDLIDDTPILNDINLLENLKTRGDWR